MSKSQFKAPPPWYHICFPDVKGWTPIFAKSVLKYINYPQFKYSDEVNALLTSGFYPPNYTLASNSLNLTPNEFASYYPPEDIQRDTDVIGAVAFYQGVCNQHLEALAPWITKGVVERGVAKISAHPLTLILVAAPYVRAKNLVSIRDDNMDRNYLEVENSLIDGTWMCRSDMDAWLDSIVLRPALMEAVRERAAGRFRVLPTGWWAPGGEPFSPYIGTQELFIPLKEDNA